MMHRFFILMVLGIFTISCEDDIHPSQIPSVVENTFKSNFPHATDVEWESYGDDFEVDFEFKKTEYAARIDKAGNLMEYKYEIAPNTLPPTIITAMKTEYSNKKWEDTEILVSGRNIYYQMEIDGFFNDKKIVLDSTGKKINNIKSWN